MSDQLAKSLVIDIDGTICSQEKTGTYHLAKPKKDIIKKINQLWSDGWTIIFFTARGMSTCNGNLDMIENRYREMTEKWMTDNRVCYDELRFGKPDAVWFVDDKAMTPESFMGWEE